VGGLRAVSEIPLLSSIPYLIGKTELSCKALDFGVKAGRSAVGRSAPMTVSGGEFDWGGTSVKL
jgi:Cys-tRNA synthase (O-phospho-L-seryl-tRNA:Cys-tRNA synthase)